MFALARNRRNSGSTLLLVAVGVAACFRSPHVQQEGPALCWRSPSLPEIIRFAGRSGQSPLRRCQIRQSR